MIFEEIVLHNFGIYKGRHVVKLTPPSPKKTIILLGGLNGSGKTTLLDALQLTLYGKFAKYSNRGNINYFDYLSSMINYHVDPSNGAALELQFKHFKNGKEESIRVHRSWYSTGKNIKEIVEVKRDGILDPIITNRWYEYVEEFIPAKISSLFFFDGEKIEAFADQNKAGALLRTGIHALLGLDLVDRLSTDLLTLERKRKAQLQSQQTRANITALETEVERLEKKAKEIAQQKTEAQRRLTQAKKEQDKLKEEYRREGGELFEQRGIIENQLKTAQEKLFILEEQLRELATGDAPLILVQHLLRETEQQAIAEKKAKHLSGLHEELEKRDTTLLQLLKQHDVKQSALIAVEAFIQAEQLKREKYIETECYLNIDTKHFVPLHFNQIIANTNTLIAQSETVTDEINACEQQLASIPDPESLEGITERLANIQNEIEKTNLRIKRLEYEYDAICRKMARRKAQMVEVSETEMQEQFTNETTQRVIKHTEKVRSTLEKFAHAVTQKHILQLESLILDSFQQLSRKEHFINQIEIEPKNYTLTLYTATQEKVLPESLSAGERQLLAVSILWGLSRASGRPLPAIIDTPLSRLDGKHRKNLVDNYFYQASHQVILLSTDEEINKKYYRCLKPAIGREYHISYEEDKDSSIINPGYFF